MTLSHAHLGVILWPDAVGSVIYICAKFEAGISIRSKVIRGPEISKFGHVTQATPTLGSFCGTDAVGVRHMSVRNLKQISPILQKL